MTETDHPLMLPEWAPQSAVWVGWPRLPGEWDEAFEPARRQIAGFIAELVRHVPVRVAIGDDRAEAAAREMIAPAAQLHRVPTGDIWLRDTGPVLAAGGGRLLAACFDFNGWGGKYDMPGDRATGSAIAAAEALPTARHGFILEGGAIDTDGAGTILTTRACLLNPNRNTGWSEADAERALEAALGARRVVWIEDGLTGDHTDGHIDNIARFIAPGRVACQRASGPDDPHRERLAEIEAQLRAAGLEVETLPSPGRVRDAAGDALPASHMNFLITNGAVLMPAYDEANAAAAAARLAELFPGRHIAALPSRDILAGGGSFHCMTCQIPAEEGET